MRFDLRVTAPYDDVARALQGLVDDGVLDAHAPTARVSFGLRPSAGEDAVDVVLFVEGVDELAGATVTSALRQLGFHVDESSYDDEDAADRAFEVIEDVLEPGDSTTARDLADPDRPQPESPEPV